MSLDNEKLINALKVTGLSEKVDPLKLERAFLTSSNGGVCLNWTVEGDEEILQVHLEGGVNDAMEFMRAGIGFTINGEVKKDCKFETYEVGGCEVYR